MDFLLKPLSPFVAETSVLAAFDMALIFKIISCNRKVKTSPTIIGTNLPFSFVAETLVLAVFDTATRLKIISKNRNT